ncbi:MAG: hypothetical protein JW825_05885 [Candidatus Methanofastidiosa archaeon]|nr:hypothetical protein [Candidatus Methanofastidiosa archaeon]
MKIPSFIDNIRIIIWLIVLIGSIVAINPSFTDGFGTDLQFGLEIEGGSWINLELEGNLVQAEGDSATIFEYLIEQRSEIDVTFVGLTEEVFTFSAEDLETNERAITNSITWATPTFDTEAGTFTFESTDNTALGTILQYINGGSKVTLVSFEDEEWFEVRRSLTSEEETLADEMTRQDFESYLLDWYNEKLEGIATVTRLLNRVSPETTKDSRDIISTKLNYLGLSDIPVKTIENDRYISVEFAGLELGEAESLVTEQGKFEIKIVVEAADETGEENIYDYVTSGSEIKSVDHYTKGLTDLKWYVPFNLSQEGAEAFAAKCIQYDAINYPNEHQIAMFLDDVLIFEAPIQGTLADSIEDGSWVNDGELLASFGTADEDAERARNLWIQMNAGALPVKQRVVTEGYVSPTLGSLFLKEIVYAGIAAILVVGLIVYLRYKKPKITLPLLVTAFSETIIVLGVASLIGHQLDLPSIAGVLATLGTGVDQMVIITDEVTSGEDGGGKLRVSLTKRVSRAFAIIFASATTTIMAMIPLAYMQLGVLRGFAIITIIGILVGVFITRPTYAKVINIILGQDKSSR